MKHIKIYPEFKPRTEHVNYNSGKDMYTPDWDARGGMTEAMIRVKERNGSIRRVPKGAKGLSRRAAKNVEQVNDRG